MYLKSKRVRDLEDENQFSFQRTYISMIHKWRWVAVTEKEETLEP